MTRIEIVKNVPHTRPHRVRTTDQLVLQLNQLFHQRIPLAHQHPKSPQGPRGLRVQLDFRPLPARTRHMIRQISQNIGVAPVCLHFRRQEVPSLLHLVRLGKADSVSPTREKLAYILTSR